MMVWKTYLPALRDEPIKEFEKRRGDLQNVGILTGALLHLTVCARHPSRDPLVLFLDTPGESSALLIGSGHSHKIFATAGATSSFPWHHFHKWLGWIWRGLWHWCLDGRVEFPVTGEGSLIESDAKGRDLNVVVNQWRACGWQVTAVLVIFLNERSRGVVAQPEPGLPANMPVIARFECDAFALPRSVGEAEGAPVPFFQGAGHMGSGTDTQRLAHQLSPGGGDLDRRDRISFKKGHPLRDDAAAAQHLCAQMVHRDKAALFQRFQRRAGALADLLGRREMAF